MGGHQSAAAMKVEWLTPPHVLEALGPFDLDPCAPIPDRRPWETAAKSFDIDDDGLSRRWHGRVWLNPPYGRETGVWLQRLAEHGNGIALIFARTETEMFFDEVWAKASSVLFLKGRLTFHHADGSKAAANAGAPSALVSYGHEQAAVLEACGLEGAFVDLRKGAEQSLVDDLI